MRKKSKIIAAIAAICLFIGIGVLLWPLNGYIESPGEADDLAKFVKIGGKNDTAKGRYNITSVYLSKANVFGYLQTKNQSTIILCVCRRSHWW